jgi:hypothetical protein
MAFKERDPVQPDGPERPCTDFSHFKTNAIVPQRVAADWTGITLAELNQLIRDGAVKTQTIKKSLYVDLDSLESALRKEFGS